MDNFIKLNIDQTSIISGGWNNFRCFCSGFGASAAVYEVGVLANWWNPVGWVGQGVLVGVGIACVINEL